MKACVPIIAGIGLLIPLIANQFSSRSIPLRVIACVTTATYQTDGVDVSAIVQLENATDKDIQLLSVVSDCACIAHEGTPVTIKKNCVNAIRLKMKAKTEMVKSGFTVGVDLVWSDGVASFPWSVRSPVELASYDDPTSYAVSPLLLFSHTQPQISPDGK